MNGTSDAAAGVLPAATIPRKRELARVSWRCPPSLASPGRVTGFD